MLNITSDFARNTCFASASTFTFFQSHNWIPRKICFLRIVESEPGSNILDYSLTSMIPFSMIRFGSYLMGHNGYALRRCSSRWADAQPSCGGRDRGTLAHSCVKHVFPFRNIAYQQLQLPIPVSDEVIPSGLRTIIEVYVWRC